MKKKNPLPARPAVNTCRKMNKTFSSDVLGRSQARRSMSRCPMSLKNHGEVCAATPRSVWGKTARVLIRYRRPCPCAVQRMLNQPCARTWTCGYRSNRARVKEARVNPQNIP